MSSTRHPIMTPNTQLNRYARKPVRLHAVSEPTPNPPTSPSRPRRQWSPQSRWARTPTSGSTHENDEETALGAVAAVEPMSRSFQYARAPTYASTHRMGEHGSQPMRPG